jgi:hypothetical protein
MRTRRAPSGSPPRRKDMGGRDRAAHARDRYPARAARQIAHCRRQAGSVMIVR